MRETFTEWPAWHGIKDGIFYCEWDWPGDKLPILSTDLAVGHFPMESRCNMSFGPTGHHWVCTLGQGHKGRHVGHGDSSTGSVVAIWMPVQKLDREIFQKACEELDRILTQ